MIDRREPVKTIGLAIEGVLPGLPAPEENTDAL